MSDPVTPPIMRQKQGVAGLLDVGDRSVDLECLGDGLAALGDQTVALKAAKRDPIMTRFNRSPYNPTP